MEASTGAGFVPQSAADASRAVVGADAASSAALHAQLQQLFLLTHLQQQQHAAAAAADADASASVELPLAVLNRGYKRKYSSIDSNQGANPHEGVGTPIDESSPFWGAGPPSVIPGGAGGFMASASGSQGANNRRNKTFSSEMSDLFVHEVIHRKETLVENNTNREVDFNRQKKQAWQEVYDALRVHYPTFTCSVEGMKTHWRYRKRRVRDAAPYMKRFREQGVGVDAIGDRMNDADWAIYDILAGTGSIKSENGDKAESDLEEKDIPTPPAKYAKLEDIKCEDSNSRSFPISPASIVTSCGEDSNSGLSAPPTFSLANAASLLLSASTLPTIVNAPTSTVTTMASSSRIHHPIALAPAQAPAVGPMTPPISPAEQAEYRRLQHELIKQQTVFFTSMNDLVADLRTSLPLIIAQFLQNNTPLASPANSSSSSVDVSHQ